MNDKHSDLALLGAKFQFFVYPSYLGIPLAVHVG